MMHLKIIKKKHTKIKAMFFQIKNFVKKTIWGDRLHQVVTEDLEIAIAQDFFIKHSRLLIKNLNKTILEKSALEKHRYKLLRDFFPLSKSQWHVSKVSEDRLHFTNRKIEQDHKATVPLCLVWVWVLESACIAGWDTNLNTINFRDAWTEFWCSIRNS